MGSADSPEASPSPGCRRTRPTTCGSRATRRQVSALLAEDPACSATAARSAQAQLPKPDQRSPTHPHSSIHPEPHLHPHPSPPPPPSPHSTRDDAADSQLLPATTGGDGKV